MHFAGFAILAVIAATQHPSQPPAAMERPVYRIPQIRQDVRAYFAAPDRHAAANEPRLFTCPKDGAQLRVPPEKSTTKYTCPIDGTEMQASKPAGRILMLQRP
jgi:hypothetical protein